MQNDSLHSTTVQFFITLLQCTIWTFSVLRMLKYYGLDTIMVSRLLNISEQNATLLVNLFDKNKNSKIDYYDFFKDTETCNIH